MSFTRSHDPMPNARRDNVRPRFHIEAIHDEGASAQAGHPVFRNEERVQHIIPGGFNSPVERVNDAHRARWPAEYTAFKAGTTMAETGTPLEHWALLTPAQVKELKAQDIHTVEQCAALNDEVLSRSRSPGMRGVRNAAKTYLDDAEGMKLTTELTRLNDLLQSQNTEYRKQLEVQARAIETMQAQILQLGSSLSGAQTYIPGQHDPMEAARQQMQQQAMQAAAAGQAAGQSAGSSLDDFVLPRRRGRPPNSARTDDDGAAASAAA